MSEVLSEKTKAIQERVVGMYSEHPWPMTRDADEEMGWRLKCLGVRPEHYQGKKVLDMGCGTGEYALWYADHGAAEVTGIDLSQGSLNIAEGRRRQGGFDQVTFQEMDILNCSLPDDYFDYSYSVGVLHHTGEPLRGFQHLVRITKPGGVVIVSLYNSYSRRVLRAKQTICRWLGGDDIDKRVYWGEKLFAGTMRKLDARYHGTNTKQIAYDIFGFPHESLHSGAEVLGWFDQTGVEFMGAFAPLRVRDYFYAFNQPEYARFRNTFEGFPVMRLVADSMTKLAKRLGPKDDEVPPFPRPGRLSMVMCQSMWIAFGLRFNCFTMAGIKKG